MDFLFQVWYSLNDEKVRGNMKLKHNNTDEELIDLENNKTKNGFSTPEVILLVILTLLIGLTFGRLLNGGKIARQFIKSNDKYIDQFVKNYEYIVDNYYKEIDKEQLINDAIAGMMNSLDDPYSVYFDEAESSNFNITLDGSYKGIGIQITKDEDSGYMLVSSIFKNSPAEKAGLKVGDKIISMDGEDLKDLSASEFSSKVRKSEKNTFNLIALRDEKEVKVSINKEVVVLDSVTSKVYKENNKKIGYIYVGIFANNTYAQFKEHLDKLEKGGIDSLIIDVRSNTGGHLTTVDKMLDLFLNSNQIMYQFEKNGKTTKTYGKGDESKKYDIVLLANEMSASASEVLIAGLKENLDAKLIGKKTYGKGTVQELINLSDGTQYKITVKKWLTPEGNWINDTEGIEPDIDIDLGDKYFESMKEEDDSQLNAAINYLKSK